MTRTKLLHVDAVVDNDGLTAIAVVEKHHDDARPVVARIIRSTGSVEGEMRAVLLAMTVATKARWEDVLFHCDALGVVRMVQRKCECEPIDLRPLRDDAAEQLEAHPLWRIEWVKRTYNSSAHSMAGQIMRAYKHGREHGRLEAEEFQEKRSDWEVPNA